MNKQQARNEQHFMNEGSQNSVESVLLNILKYGKICLPIVKIAKISKKKKTNMQRSGDILNIVEDGHYNFCRAFCGDRGGRKSHMFKSQASLKSPPLSLEPNARSAHKPSKPSQVR